MIEQLGAGKRPAVVVTIGSYTYRSTVGVMGGRSLIPVSADHRRQAGIAAGDAIDVALELGTTPRHVELPADLPKPSAQTMRHASSSKGCPPARRNGTSIPSKAPSGTITIPAEARRALRVDLPGAQVEVILRDHDLVLLPHVAVPLERVRDNGRARPGSG